MQNSDFPNLPRSWQVKTLGEVCEKISAGGDRPNDCTAEKTQENQIPIFSNGIENNGLYGYTKIPTITKPALTISARGTIGFVCVRYEPFFPIVRLICAIPNDKVLVLEFLAYALRYLIPQGEGSSIPQLTIPNFKQIKIPIPPLEIQKRIVKRLDEAFLRIKNGTKHLQSAKDNLTKYKQSLLKSAFNGTLTDDSPLSQGESTHLTHPLAPSAREGEKESRHALKSPLPQHEGHLGVGNTRNDKNSPSLAEGARGWVNPRNDNALDCHADKSARNDDKHCHTERSEVSKSKGVDFVDTSAFSKPQYDKILDSRNDDKDSLNSESSNLPQRWTIKTLGEVCEKVERRSKGYNKKEFSYIDISSIDNHKNIIIKTEKYNLDKAPSRAQQILKTNDILFSTVRTYLKNIAFVSNEYDDCIASTGFCVIRVNDKMLFPKFMFYKSLSDNFIAELNKLQRGSSYPAVSDKDVFAQQIKIPPLETQKQIVAILERHFTSADKVSAYIESCLTKAKQLKSSLLKSAFEGKL